MSWWNREKIFFNNVLEGLREAGIDIEDPLEMILTLKHFDPVKFESAFHPTTYKKDNLAIKPFYPTVLGRQTLQMKNEIVEELYAQGFTEEDLKGKKIVIGSADAHTYGAMLVEGVLTAMGATIINGGVDMDLADMLDLADEESNWAYWYKLSYRSSF